MVKNPPASTGDAGSIPRSERFPEEEMATTPVFLPGKYHVQSRGSQKVGHDRAH